MNVDLFKFPLGLGPAMFGVIFYLFNVDLNDESKHVNSSNNLNDLKNGLMLNNTSSDVYHNQNNDIMTNMRHDNDNNFLAQYMPGPPFVFGSLMVVCAILVAVFIKEENPVFDAKRTSIVGERKSKIFVSVLVLFFILFPSPLFNCMKIPIFIFACRC